MSNLQGFSIEDMVQPPRGGGEIQEPKVEQLMDKLRRLKRDNRYLEEEVEKLKSVSDLLQKELENLHTEAFKLEAIRKEKEEVCSKLQFQCEESDQDVARQLQVNKKSKELLEQYRYEIQELKLKHRKQRMKFGNELDQLIEQHKNLLYVFTPERLPDELESAQNTKSQLLAAEKLKLAQLHNLDKALEEMKNQKQSEAVTAETQEEHTSDSHPFDAVFSI